MKKLLPILALLTFTSLASVHAGDTPSLPGTKVYVVNLKDGSKVKSPVKVIFGLSGMGIAPAGVEKEGSGHHHLFIDRPGFGKGEDGAEEADFNIPSDANHIHFGKGQTETMLELPLGEHTLQLVFGDQNHVPHNPPIVSDLIRIVVE